MRRQFCAGECGLAIFGQARLGQAHQRDHALVGFLRIGAETEDAVLDQHQALDGRIGLEHFRRGLGEAKARHHIGHVANALAIDLAAQRFAVGLVGQRQHRGRMGVVDEFVRNEGVQQRLDGRIGRGGIDQIGALQTHHFLVGKLLTVAQFFQRREPHRRQARGLDSAHVPAGTLDAEDVDGIAVEIGEARFHRGVAAAMQHQPRILAQKPRGIDPQRHVAAEACIALHRSIGVAIGPGTLHPLAFFAIRPPPRSVPETPPQSRHDRHAARRAR